MSANISWLLFIVFLVLKLCKVIDWSWWWVTAPLWGSFILSFIFGFCKEYKRQSQMEKLHSNSRFMQRLEEAQRKREELIKEQNQK